MSMSQALLSVFLLVLSVQSHGYADSAEALKALQAKVNETINDNRTFYSCESTFEKSAFYYQGKDLTKWYSINVAGITTPLANSNLVNEISTDTKDNVTFQKTYEKRVAKPYREHRLPTIATSDIEIFTYVFQMQLGEVPRIQHSYKQGYIGYYTSLARGTCAKLDAVQFEAALAKRIRR